MSKLEDNARPTWARYIATDRCGVSWYFERRPVPDAWLGEWMVRLNGKCEPIAASLLTRKENPDWLASCLKLF